MPIALSKVAKEMLVVFGNVTSMVESMGIPTEPRVNFNEYDVSIVLRLSDG